MHHCTGISCKEKNRKENFQMFLSLIFLITKLFLESESLLLFKLNYLMVPIGNKPAPGDHESIFKIFLAKFLLAGCSCASMKHSSNNTTQSLSRNRLLNKCLNYSIIMFRFLGSCSDNFN